MKTIAAAAGVSVMTVSRALRNQSVIPEKTRLRIRKIAEDLGYRPNPMISTLMAQLYGTRTQAESPVICYVTMYPDPEHWKDLTYNLSAYRGAKRRAEELGYCLEHFCITEPGMNIYRANRILKNRGVLGLLFPPLPIPHPEKLEIDWDFFACATIGYHYKSPELHRAMVDHTMLVRLIYRNLWERGYRRIGVALRPIDDDEVENKWMAGFCLEQFYRQASTRVPFFLEENWNKETFTRWLLQNQPEVVVSIQPEVVDWIREAGLRIPQDIGVALQDLSPKQISEGFSGIDQRTELVGEMALDLVVEQITHNQRGIPKVAKLIMVEGVWVEGKMIRPASQCISPANHLTKASQVIKAADLAETASPIAAARTKSKAEPPPDTFSNYRDGRDEINLAEFPIAAVGFRTNADATQIVFCDTILNTSINERVTRKLTITGVRQHGLPTSPDEEILLGLLQISRIRNFDSPKLLFTPYQLLKIVGWNPTTNNYRRLKESIDRWQAVTLRYESAWWDPRSGSWRDREFRFLEQAEFYQQGKASILASEGHSIIHWSEPVFQSFSEGNLKTLDFELFRRLSGGIGKRLFRFLDKCFLTENYWTFDLETFGCEKIGITKPLKKSDSGQLVLDIAQIKRRLLPALKELETNGYVVPLPLDRRFTKSAGGKWLIHVGRASASLDP